MRQFKPAPMILLAHVCINPFRHIRLRKRVWIWQVLPILICPLLGQINPLHLLPDPPSSCPTLLPLLYTLLFPIPPPAPGLPAPSAGMCRKALVFLLAHWQLVLTQSALWLLYGSLVECIFHWGASWLGLSHRTPRCYLCWERFRMASDILNNRTCKNLDSQF